MRIGALEVLPVIDGTWRHAASELYASQPDDEAWAPHKYLVGDDGMLELTIGGFLVRHEHNDRVVLVDLGLGGNDLFDMQDVPVAAAHFPGLRFGRIFPGQQHRRFEFL